MKELDEHTLKKFARSILFENNISEMFQPDDDTTLGLNMRYNMHDRPVPQINGDGKNLSIDIELPIGSSDIASNPATIISKTSPDSLYSPQYCPDNVKELSVSIISLLDNENNDDVNKEVIQKIWNSLTDILEKAK